MACIGITGAFRTTPTAALEVAIGLTPLPLWIEGEARASYLWICRFGNVTLRGNIVHLNFSRDTVLENMFNMRTDTNVLTRRREYGTYLATARRHRRRIKMQKRDE